MRENRITGFLTAILGLLSACGAPNVKGVGQIGLPMSQNDSQCGAEGIRGEMWLVDFDPTAKVRMQTLAEKGVLLVTYHNCQLELLRGCEIPGDYRFTAGERIRNTEYIRSRNELFAKLPLGALKLDAEYSDGDQWFLDYVLTGSSDATVARIDRKTLPEQCQHATHFIQGMVVGAYQLRAKAEVRADAGLTVAKKAGVGGGHSGEAGVIREDGSFRSCVGDGQNNAAGQCRSVVKIYLEPVHGSVSRKSDFKPAAKLELGVIQYNKRELVSYPHYVVPFAGFTAKGIRAFFPPALRAQWERMEGIHEEIEKWRRRESRELEVLETGTLRCHTDRACDSAVWVQKELRLKQKNEQQMKMKQALLQKISDDVYRRLEQEVAKKTSKKEPPGAMGLALADLMYQKLYRQNLDQSVKNDQSPELNREISALEQPPSLTMLKTIIEESYASDEIGWWARYLAALQLLDIGREEESIVLLQELAETAWQRQTAHVFFLLGNYYEDEESDFEQSLNCYLQMAEVAKKFRDDHDYGVAVVLGASASFHAGRFTQGITMALSILNDSSQSPLFFYMTALAAECVEHLGGFEQDSLSDASPEVFSKIAHVLATRAIKRNAIGEAVAIWKAMQKRAPNALEAPFALDGLAAAAKRSGDVETARALEKQRTEQYGLTSRWAEALREQRDVLGTPTDQEIASVVGATVPELPAAAGDKETLRLDALARIDGLFSHCFAPVNENRYFDLAVEIQVTPRSAQKADVAILSKSGTTSKAGDRSVDAALRCIESDGKRYFSGAVADVHAVIGALPSSEGDVEISSDSTPQAKP